MTVCYFALSESKVRHFVGGVEYAGHVATLGDCLIGEAETGKFFDVGLFKSEVPNFEEVESFAR